MTDPPSKPEWLQVNRAGILSAVLYAAILPAAATTILSLFAKAHWVLDLLSHFRVQHLAWFAVWAVVAIVLRRRNPAIVAATFAVFTAIPVAHYLPQRLSNSPENRDFRVVSFNVLEFNPRREDVADWILSQEADLVVLPEFSTRWLEEFKALDKDYPHRFRNPGYGNFGLVIYSRWPITAQKRHSFCARSLPCLEATIDLAGKPLRIIGVHPMAPVSEADTRLRDEHLENLSSYLERISGPTVVAGDFNTTVFSPSFRSTIGRLGLHDAGRGRGNNPTYHAFHPFFGVQIDHVLHTPELETVAFRTGPKLGSDHSPVIVDLKFK